MKIGYFPGCTLHSSAREFDKSLKAVSGPLGIELVEVEDWACCGATSAHATNYLLSIALPARTLALAEEQGIEKLLVPCAACYSRMATANHELARDEKLKAKVEEAIGRSYSNGVEVVSITEFMRNIAPTIKEKVSEKLSDVQVACYYGCLLVRPPEIHTYDDTEDPSSMETIAKATGAKAVSWNMRLECCGGGFSIPRTGSVVRLGRAILEDALNAGAQAVVLACPMCHSNLDLRQKAMAKRSDKEMMIPILYITQLVGLALGLDPASLDLKRHFVKTKPFVETINAKAGSQKVAEASR